MHLAITAMELQARTLNYQTMTYHWVRIAGSPLNKYGYHRVYKHIGPINCAKTDTAYRTKTWFSYVSPRTGHWYAPKPVYSHAKSSAKWRCAKGGPGEPGR